MRAFVPFVVVVSMSCGQQMMSPDAGPAELRCDPMPAAVTLTGEVQAQIFDRHCKSCHNAFDASNGDYSEASKTAAAVAKASKYGTLKVVEPNDLTRSALWLKVAGQRGPGGQAVGGLMPPGGALPADQQKLLKDWICTGAK